MAGRYTESRLLQAIGVLAFVVGLVGFVVFGWEFGGTSDILPTALGVLAAAIAVVWTLVRNR